MDKNTSLTIRGMAILLIVGFHFQFDIFSFLFLVREGEGIGSYLSRSALFVGENPLSMLFILSSMGFGALMFLTGIILSTFKLGTIFSDMFLGVGLFIILFSVFKKLSSPFVRVTEKIGTKSYSVYLYQEPAMKMILSILVGRSL